MCALKKKKQDEEYVCLREGKTRRSNVFDHKRCGVIIRAGCGAKIAVVKSKLGKYVVGLFVEGQNHSLSTAQKVHLLRSHQSVSTAQKCLSQRFAAANIPTLQQISLVEVQDGGLQKMGYVENDLYNNDRNFRNEMMGHHGDLLYEHFWSEKEKLFIPFQYQIWK